MPTGKTLKFISVFCHSNLFKDKIIYVHIMCVICILFNLITEFANMQAEKFVTLQHHEK